MVNAYAEQWSSVAISESESTYFYDPASVIKEGSTVKYWELANYKKPLTAGNLTVASSKSLMLADCQSDRYRTLRVIDYDMSDARGRIVNINLTENSPWLKTNEGSVDDAMLRMVCKSAN